MLRDIWVREKISGKADAKTIEHLFSVVKEQVGMDRLVQDYIRDIQLVRNRAAHGEQIVIEDCIECLRKMSMVLEWYFRRYVPESSSSKGADSQHKSGRKPVRIPKHPSLEQGR